MKGRFEVGNRMGKGRPVGSRNRITSFREALDEGGLAIIQEIKSQALKADPTAMRLCMERLLPVAKTPNSCFQLPPIGTAAELSAAIAAVVKAVSEGRLSAAEGESVARIIESQLRVFEAAEFDERLRFLEEARP
jgi:hypothetical protein